MAQLLLNTFTAYQQTEQEQLAGMSLTPEQKQFIQTQIAGIAESILALKPDPLNYAVFVQEEAHLKGQLEFAKYLMDCSEDAQQRILDAAQQQSQ